MKFPEISGIEIFKNEGLKITVELGLKTTDFLDVQFNLDKSEYRPYRKPDNPPIYIDSKSNHPKTILKKLLLINQLTSTALRILIEPKLRKLSLL